MKTGLLAAASFVFILFSALSLPPSVQAWDGDVTLWTTTVQPGTNTSISARITNNWTRDIYVNSANLSIDWPGGPSNLNATGLPRGLVPTEAINVQWPASVPSTLPVGGKYNVTIDVNATERNSNGTWGASSTKSWRLEVTIRSVNLDDGDGPIINFPGIDISTPLGVFCLGLAIFVVVVILLLIILLVKRRRPKPQ